jgi:tRNA nucleotidyltransferase (CCA-adding enzyme)
MNAGWELYPHDADMGVCGYGPTREAAFEQAALAMTAVVTDPQNVQALECIEVGCEAPDDELLFVAWLNALIYEMAVRNMLFSRFEVHLSGARLSGRAWGERIDRARHAPAVEIKGATYTSLCVEGDAQRGWRARTVVDV